MRMRGLVVPFPITPIEQLAAVYRDSLYMPDPSALYALMGAVAANMVEGTPAWLMFVGSPGCGKSELLNSLLTIPGMVEAADIAGEAAFLSATAKKDRAGDATGGLLTQVGDHGGLILNDFTSILSKHPDKIHSIMAVFREAFGGRWTRHVGAEGGRALHWTGKIGLYAGVTGAIDQHHRMTAELGERWVYWRFPECRDDDAFGPSITALENGRGGWRDTIRAAAAKFLGDLGLSHGTPIPRRDFTMAEQLHIIGLATITARCRSAVPRDQFSKDIIGARESEVGTRLATVLGQLLIGLDRIGVPEPGIWRLLTKIALDSMPRLRKIVVDAVSMEPQTEPQLYKLMCCSKKVAARVVEDLEVHEVIAKSGGKLSFTPWMREQFRKFVK